MSGYTKYTRAARRRSLIPVVIPLVAACGPSASEPQTEPLVMQADRLALTAQTSCLLEATGAIVCWGLNGVERFAPAGGSQRWVALRGGFDHFCGLTSDSTARCWGRNDYGQLGDGTRMARTLPTRVNTTLKFVAIHASAHTTCALDPGGRAYCWGRNEFGGVGDGTMAEGSVVLQPKPVAGAIRFRALSGDWPNCGLSLDGRAYCWGSVPGSYDPNAFRAPGDCASTFYLWYAGRQCVTPTPIAGDTRFASLAGDRCGLTAQGVAYCWGDGYYGTFGDGRTGVYSVAPVAVSGSTSFAQLTSAATHVCALDTAGTAYCWGNNFNGLLGIGESGSASGPGKLATPTRVLTTERFGSIVAGSGHTCALTPDGRVWCWGNNDSRQLGPTSPIGSSNVPVLVQLPLPSRPA